MKDWKRAVVFACAAVLAGAVWSGGARAAVVDKSSPYEGEYFIAYNPAVGYSGDSQSGLMPANLLLEGIDPLTEEEPVKEADVIHVRINEDGQEIYQMEPRNLTERIKPPMRKFSFYANRPTVPPAIGDERDFITINMVNDDSEDTPFVLKYSGENCNIWLEKEDAHNVTDEMIAELGNEYDYYIHRQVQTAFGEAYDRNGDGKMAIFLYDIKDGYDGNAVTQCTGGFFMPADLVGTEFNNMDVLHIDTYPSIEYVNGIPDLSQIKSTLVHELQHLIEESACIEPDPRDPGEIRVVRGELPIWVNEGLSMAAEHMFYGVLDSRIDYYNSWSYYVNIPLADWDNGDVLSHYSLSYLFMQYLRTQTKEFEGGGEELYKTIINAKKRNALCVEEALKQYFPYISYADIIRNFYIALTLKEDTGLHGFAGEPAFDTVRTRLHEDGYSLYLGNGAAVVSRLNGSYEPTPDEDNACVRYAAFGPVASGKEVPVDAPMSNYDSREFYQFKNITLSCCERQATMYYTMDGTEPDETSLVYDGKPIVLLSTCDLWAVTITPEGKRSDISKYHYDIVEEEYELVRHTAGANAGMWIEGIVAAPDGGIVQVGYAWGTVFGVDDFYGLTTLQSWPSSDCDPFIVKYDLNGKQSWIRNLKGINTQARFLSVDASEDGYLAVGVVGGGYPYYNYDGDYTGMERAFPDKYYGAGFVAKFSLTGNVQ